MRMLPVTKRVLLAVAVIGLYVLARAAPADCPTITVACPEAGSTIEFTAKVSPENAKLKLTYRWTVTRGEIKSGQGTPQITVYADRNGQGLGASVEVLGLRANCANKASCYVTHF